MRYYNREGMFPDMERSNESIRVFSENVGIIWRLLPEVKRLHRIYLLMKSQKIGVQRPNKQNQRYYFLGNR